MRHTLATPETAHRTGRRPWRLAALAAASVVALAACGASASGTNTTPTTSAPAATAPNPVTSSPGATAPVAPMAITHVAAATAAVNIVNFKFTPAALTIKVGTTIVWTNKDAIAHTVNFATGGINSNPLNQNDQFTQTFTTPGTYAYICSIHPFMHGSVTVTA